VMAAFTLAAVTALFAFWTYGRIEEVVRSQVASVLQSTLESAIAGIDLAMGDAARGVDAALGDPPVARALAGCLSDSEACAGLPAALEPHLRAGGFSGFALLEDAGRLRAGGPAELAAAPLRAARQRAGAAAVAILPASLARSEIWFAARVLQPMAAELVLALPAARLAHVFRAGRPGETGETYAFDAVGRMLSESRFTSQLRAAGLLGPNQASAVLTVELRDPGGDVTEGFRAAQMRHSLPLTRMAADAVRGGHGVDVRGYRDYRGVEVFGAWRWLDRYGFGVTSELDAREALRTLSRLRGILSSMVGVLVFAALALLAALALADRLRRRAEHAENLAERFGQYRLIRKIGEGGMGAVYLARHDMLRRPAAIKLLRPERASEEASARFEREVRITATLKHPNTVHVYDYGRTESGGLFYVMEYLEGIDLQHLIERFGPLPAARVIHFLRQLCGSLAEAHAAELVHRDIKPANLLTCMHGGVADTLKVLDFGVVKARRRDSGMITEDRIVLGTPEFMAPESFESAEQASPASDIYSIGAVAYFLLTGRSVFEADSLTALLTAQLTQPPQPPSRQLGAVIDSVLERAIMACLAKSPSARPRSARALSTLLDRSPEAHSWGAEQADAWWSAHAHELADLRASVIPAATPDAASSLRPIRKLTSEADDSAASPL
jgi:eukaryotic-like serine/threonine-protein kinase